MFVPQHAKGTTEVVRYLQPSSKNRYLADHVISPKTLTLPLNKLMLAALAGLPRDEER
jgi:hypothetical protein